MRRRPFDVDAFTRRWVDIKRGAREKPLLTVYIAGGLPPTRAERSTQWTGCVCVGEESFPRTITRSQPALKYSCGGGVGTEYLQKSTPATQGHSG